MTFNPGMDELLLIHADIKAMRVSKRGTETELELKKKQTLKKPAIRFRDDVRKN